MREIKFRAWDKIRGCIVNSEAIDSLTVYGVNEKLGIDFEIEHDLPSGNYHEDISRNPDQCILMQYTGLKDTKGKEIYEGDIGKIYKRPNGQIRWASGGWFLDWGDRGEYVHHDDLAKSFNFKIIGNIYENAELLRTEI